MKVETAPAATPAYADPRDVASFAHGLEDNYLQCRELGHNWRRWVARWVADQDAYERALRCPRCGAERWQTLSDRGSVLTNNYKYPEEYVIKGLGRIVGDGRDALRLESLARDISDHEHKEAS